MSSQLLRQAIVTSPSSAHDSRGGRAVTKDGLGQLFVGAIIALLPVRAISPVASSFVSPGLILAVILLPVIFPALWRTRWGKLLYISYGALVTSGVVLLSLARDRTIDSSLGATMFLTMAATLVHLAALVWARGALGTRRTILLYTGGQIAQVGLSLAQTEGNPWKYGLAVPATLFALALVWTRGPIWSVSVLIVSAGISILFDYRSFITFALFTIFAWLWVVRRTATRPFLKLAATAAAIYLVYNFAIWAALNGWLGERNRLTTQTQLQDSGSVISGGRVESGVALALFSHRPLGYGPGVLPNGDDIALGANALSQRGVQFQGHTMMNYMFGHEIKLHSLTSDLWSSFGFGGLAVACVIAMIAVGAFVQALHHTQTPAVKVFMIVIVMWDLAFSPIGSNLWETILITAMLLPRYGQHYIALKTGPSTNSLSQA